MAQNAAPQRIVIVLPICDRDLHALTRGLCWLRELDGQIPTDAVASIDNSTNRILAAEAINVARAVFESVTEFRYPEPHMSRWPNGPNWAFQQTALFMQGYSDRPWFWMEPDCVALKRGWFDLWQAEYDRCGKPIMGHIVEGRGHLNGTAVYPANFPDLSPAAMAADDVAWDWVMKEDTIHLSHHTTLLGHVWGVVHGRPTPYDGTPAQFPAQSDVDRIVPPGAILFHRSKYCDLIDRMRERLYANRNINSKLQKGHPVPAV